MFRHNRVRTLVELKQLILSHLGPAGGLEIANLAYRFQVTTADNRLEYRPSWISEDSHVWMTFEVHKRVMDGKFMEFYAEVRHVGSSRGLFPPGPSTDPAPSPVLALEDATMRDYNSGENSDYEEDSSCIAPRKTRRCRTPRVDVPGWSSPHRCPSLTLHMYLVISSS
ncbi:hypothetical protein PIB30_019050 [Stylosanthes scabra]|uniref:Uncharacterized protein n=1 Tax=Stylosanthes scabra TaxID=79078 RepID=A0ABU6S8G3_9FABA|nr:hypothetical protein [Stylosanthes scabra]